MKILSLTPHKRITYTPGMISLLLLPVFCLMFLHQHKAFTKLNGMSVVFMDDDWNRKLPAKYQFRFQDARSYIAVNFSGNTASDRSLLDFARSEIKTLIRTQNKTLGIRFHFNSKTQYQTFVSAIDMCSVDDGISWASYHDDIYVLYSKR
jgi:hypothetical protein